MEICLNIVEMVMALGAKDDSDPLCLFRTENGEIEYITGDIIAKYYRFMTRLVFPATSATDPKLISCHSLCAKAAVILHEVGMDGTYIKLHIRWISDCFQVYLHNTHTIFE